MFIVLKYSHDVKDIQVLPFNDATGIVSISSDNNFWTQKKTDIKYKMGEIAKDSFQNIPNQPIVVFDSENICHYRLVNFFMQNYFKRKK